MRCTLLFCAMLLFFSCREGEQGILLRVEELPEAWQGFQNLRYSFRWYDGEMRTAERSVPEIKLFLPAIPGLPVLVYPVYRTVLFKPAGALYSLANSGVLTARWKDGIAGEMLLEMLHQGRALTHLNVQKLLDTARTLDDPWLIDKDKSLMRLLSPERRGTPIAKQAQSQRTVVLPIGQWHPANPFVSVLKVSGIAAARQTLLFTGGMHVYVEKQKETILYINIKENTEQLWVAEKKYQSTHIEYNYIQTGVRGKPYF